MEHEACTFQWVETEIRKSALLILTDGIGASVCILWRAALGSPD